MLIDIETSDFPTALISQGFQTFQKGKIPTFMNSGASDTMFISRDAFGKYKPVVARVGNSAKADNGTFEIVGEGSIVQCYKVEGREREITYTHTLHTPTLNANLLSIGAFIRAGLTTTFGNNKGVVQKPDGTIVLARTNVNGMYLVETIDAPNLPLVMMSLSQPTSLKQWHRR